MRFFRIVTNICTHGVTHFLLLIILTVITVCMWKAISQDSIKPHSIAVHLDYRTSFKNGFVNRTEAVSKDSLKNVSICLLLNDKTIESHTEGKYRNALKIEFEGHSRYRRKNNPKNKDSLVAEKEEPGDGDLIDSVELLVNCYPKIRAYTDSCAVIPIIDRCRPVGSGLEILEHAHKLLMDSTLHHETRMTPDSTITMFITAVNKDGFPAKHQVVIFSDDFGMSKDNPYYYYFISFPTFSFAGELRITINTYGTGLFDELNQRPNIGKFLQYNYIYPEPDVVTNGKIDRHRLWTDY